MDLIELPQKLRLSIKRLAMVGTGKGNCHLQIIPYISPCIRSTVPFAMLRVWIIAISWNETQCPKCSFREGRCDFDGWCCYRKFKWTFLEQKQYLGNVPKHCFHCMPFQNSPRSR